MTDQGSNWRFETLEEVDPAQQPCTVFSQEGAGRQADPFLHDDLMHMTTVKPPGTLNALTIALLHSNLLLLAAVAHLAGAVY